jgi:hypothetical protein
MNFGLSPQGYTLQNNIGFENENQTQCYFSVSGELSLFRLYYDR